MKQKHFKMPLKKFVEKFTRIFRELKKNFRKLFENFEKFQKPKVEILGKL